MACRHRTEHRNLMGQQGDGPNENLSFCSGVRLLYDTGISQNFKEFEIIIIKLVEKLKIITSSEMDESFLSQIPSKTKASLLSELSAYIQSYQQLQNAKLIYTGLCELRVRFTVCTHCIYFNYVYKRFLNPTYYIKSVWFWQFMNIQLSLT